MSKLKCGLIQMGLKGDGTMSPEQIRDLMIEAHIPMIEDAAKQGVKVLCFQEVFLGEVLHFSTLMSINF